MLYKVLWQTKKYAESFVEADSIEEAREKCADDDNIIDFEECDGDWMWEIVEINEDE